MGKESHWADDIELENQICPEIVEKFAQKGIKVFQEVTLEKAVEILGYPRGMILEALHTCKLPGRRVGRKDLIEIRNLYCWAVELEKRRKR